MTQALMADYTVQLCVCHTNIVGDLYLGFYADCNIEKGIVLTLAVFE